MYRAAWLISAWLWLAGTAPSARGEAGPTPDPSLATVPERPQIVVTTTMLGSAVAEMADPWADLTVLTPPSACPGQFDIGPKATMALSRASLVLRHDYELFLDSKLVGAGMPHRKLMSVKTDGAQTIPENYLALCGQVSQILCIYFPDQADSVRRRFAEARARILGLAQTARSRAQQAVQGKSFVVASYQSEFVSWAGAQTPITYEQGEELSLEGLHDLMADAVEAHAVGVVGNLQWGERELSALTEALGIPGANLSDYPAASEPRAYDRLLTSNVDLLVSLAEKGGTSGGARDGER